MKWIALMFNVKTHRGTCIVRQDIKIYSGSILLQDFFTDVVDVFRESFTRVMEMSEMGFDKVFPLQEVISSET